MSETKEIRPLPRQQVALTCPAFELMFGGQKGGAKTFFLLLCCGPLLTRAQERYAETQLEQRHVRIVIFRKNLGDLGDIIIKSHRVFKTMDSGAEFNTNYKIWRFSSGATVEFAHIDGPEDHRRWHGQEIMLLLIDQVEDVPFDVYAFLLANVRTDDAAYKPYLKVRCAANPGGRHGDWVKKRFVDPSPDGNQIIRTEVTNSDGSIRTVTRAFIPSALRDNPYLYDDGQYEANLRAGLPDHLVKMYLEGDWNAVVGAFFSSLIRPDRLFFDFRTQFPNGIPATWEMKFGLDWGSTAPAAGIFACKDNDGRIWIIGEHVKPGITGRRFGESMRRWFTAQKWSDSRKWEVEDLYGLIDHQAMGKYGSEGATAADGIGAYGWRIFPANKDRYAGIEQICERLQMRADGYPAMRIARDMCPVLSLALQTVRVNPKDVKDYDPDDNPHAVDGLRFLLMDWPVMELREEDPRDKAVRQWEDYINKARARQNPHERSYSYGGYE